MEIGFRGLPTCVAFHYSLVSGSSGFRGSLTSASFFSIFSGHTRVILICLWVSLMLFVGSMSIQESFKRLRSNEHFPIHLSISMFSLSLCTNKLKKISRGEHSELLWWSGVSKYSWNTWLHLLISQIEILGQEVLCTLMRLLQVCSSMLVHVFPASSCVRSSQSPMSFSYLNHEVDPSKSDGFLIVTPLHAVHLITLDFFILCAVSNVFDDVCWWNLTCDDCWTPEDLFPDPATHDVYHTSLNSDTICHYLSCQDADVFNTLGSGQNSDLGLSLDTTDTCIVHKQTNRDCATTKTDLTEVRKTTNRRVPDGKEQAQPTLVTRILITLLDLHVSSQHCLSRLSHNSIVHGSRSKISLLWEVHLNTWTTKLARQRVVELLQYFHWMLSTGLWLLHGMRHPMIQTRRDLRNFRHQ